VNQRLANFISFLFHPIFIPIYGVLAITQMHYVVSAKIMGKFGFILLGMFVLLLCVVPLYTVMLLLRKYKPKELAAINKEERSRAATILFFIYAFVAWYVEPIFIHEILRLFVVALAGSSLALAVASRFVKVSFHVFGWAGMLVLLAALSTSGDGYFIFWIVACLFVTALVASSRLSLKAHSHKEVYLGFFLGLICNIAVYLIFDGRL